MSNLNIDSIFSAMRKGIDAEGDKLADMVKNADTSRHDADDEITDGRVEV